MAFAVEDFEDLIQLLEEHPEWRQRLRANVLGRDFEELPAIVRDLAEAQRRTEARVEELADAQRSTEARIEELADAQRQLTEAQRRTEARVEDLAEAMRQLAESQRQTDGILQAFSERMEKSLLALGGRMDKLTEELGAVYELMYKDRVLPHFGRWLRKPVVVRPDEIPEVDVARDDGTLSEDDFADLTVADMIIRGNEKGTSERIYLAVEVSRTVNPDDVTRAIRRAAILQGVGLRSRAAVGGQRITDAALDAAQENKVLVSLVRDVR